MGGIFNLEDVEIIVDDDENIVPLSLVPDLVHHKAHGGHPNDEAFSVLATAHDKSLEDIKLLTNELNLAKVRIVQLENQQGTGINCRAIYPFYIVITLKRHFSA